MKEILPSRFNVCVLSGAPNTALIFNTLTSAVATVPARDGEPDFASLPEIDRNQLKTNGILVETEELEVKAAEYWLRHARHSRKGANVTVFTTRRCNLACTYCYERFEQVSSPVADMSPDTAKSVVEWVQQYVKETGSRELHLTFYGGEPLYNYDGLRLIGTRLQAFCRAAHLEFRTYLISNATLVTPTIADELANLNLTQAQVTLDGLPAIHDRRRVTPEGAGSFHDTLRGLEILSKTCSIMLRCNLSTETLDNGAALLRYLADRGLASERIVFSPSVTMEYSPSSRIFCPSVAESAPGYAELIRLARTLGFRPRNPWTLSSCFAVTEGCFIFDVDGGIYSCATLTGHREGLIGRVPDVEMNEAFYDLMMSDPRRPECHECRYMPLCMGGCRALLRLRGVSQCQKDYFDKTMPGTLRALYGD